MFQRIVLFLGIIVAAYISTRALTAPQDVLAYFGLVVEGADGRNEIRGQYGDFFGAVTIALLLSAFDRLPRNFGLGLLLVTVGGVLFGRLASIAIEGLSVWPEYSDGIKTFIMVDIVLVALTLAALFRRSDKPKIGL
ncbi:MAG: DUF4345 family protein [Parasphingorhabdus sp.]|uniref:DUF4345 family protein n=1 Tax=Parasphingorhabdus sp. TaxID=2709688 RepID=UPI00329A0250